MNAIELLRKVKTLILDEPTRYNQSTWMDVSDLSPCHAAACIAGWTVAIHYSEMAGKRLPAIVDEIIGTVGSSSNIPFKAIELLGGDSDPVLRGRLTVLFSPTPGDSWPEPFRKRWNDALLASWQHLTMANDIAPRIELAKAQAHIAADMIEHFITG